MNIEKHATAHLLKKRSEDTAILSAELVEKNIYIIRGKKVMFDSDLERLYSVTTKVLNQAVKRNMMRFPDDFMYLLSNEEVASLRSQIVTVRMEGTENTMVTVKSGASDSLRDRKQRNRADRLDFMQRKC